MPKTGPRAAAKLTLGYEGFAGPQSPKSIPADAVQLQLDDAGRHLGSVGGN
jgi:hypothetical protein